MAMIDTRHMKTLTEFSASHIKLATAKQKEFVAAGKTPEEIPALIGADLKVEGDRLNSLMTALEMVGNKTNDIKRVVVSTVEENEKVPHPKFVKDGKYFLAEYYPPLAQKNLKGKRDFRGKSRKGPRDKKRRFGRGRRDGAQSPDGLNHPGHQTRDFRDRNKQKDGEANPEKKKFDPNRRRRPWHGKPPRPGEIKTQSTPSTTAATTPSGPPRVHVPIEPPPFVAQPKPTEEPTST